MEKYKPHKITLGWAVAAVVVVVVIHHCYLKRTMR